MLFSEFQRESVSVLRNMSQKFGADQVRNVAVSFYFTVLFYITSKQFNYDLAIFMKSIDIFKFKMTFQSSLNTPLTWNFGLLDSRRQSVVWKI